MNVIVAVYDGNNDRMAECEMREVSGETVVVSVGEGEIGIFFVDRNCRPITARMRLDA